MLVGMIWEPQQTLHFFNLALPAYSVYQIHFRTHFTAVALDKIHTFRPLLCLSDLWSCRAYGLHMDDPLNPCIQRNRPKYRNGSARNIWPVLLSPYSTGIIIFVSQMTYSNKAFHAGGSDLISGFDYVLSTWRENVSCRILFITELVCIAYIMHEINLRCCGATWIDRNRLGKYVFQPEIHIFLNDFQHTLPKQ